jgi:hypothetical protein
MAIEKFNVKSGLSVGTTAIPVIDSAANATFNSALITNTVSANIFKATVANGTAPLIVASSTVVTNLNADQIDGCHVNDAGVGTTDLWTANKIMTYSNSASGTVISVTAGNGMTQTGDMNVDPTLNVVSHAGTSGSVGTLAVGADSIGVDLGNTGTVAAAGNDARFDRTLVFSGNVSGSGASSGTIAITVLDDSHNHASAEGDFTVTGNLVVNGTTTTVNSTETTLIDPIFSIGGSGEPVPFDDHKDRGIRFYWNDVNETRAGFFGFDDSSKRFTFVPHCEITSEVVSGAIGDVEAATFYGDLLATSASATNFYGYLNGDISGNAATVTTIPTLSSEVSNIGNAVTLSNSAVIGKVLTGFTAAPGSITASDTILSALQKVQGNAAAAVSSVSVSAVNGFTGTVFDPTSAAKISIATSVIGMIKGDGNAISAAVTGIDYSNGTSALGTGIVKTTTGTGALSVAVPADFPTLNQSTTGNAFTATSAGYATVAGTSDVVSGAAQPAITSVGTLSSLGVAGNVTLGGNVTVDTDSVIQTFRLTTTSTTTTAIATLAAATYRSAEFVIQGTDSTGTKYNVTKIIAIHDGSTVSHTEFGTIVMGSSVGSFDVVYNGGISLVVTPASTNSTVFKVTASLRKI